MTEKAQSGGFTPPVLSEQFRGEKEGVTPKRGEATILSIHPGNLAESVALRSEV